MAGLEDFEPLVEEISFVQTPKDGEPKTHKFPVRGLGLTDMSAILADYVTDIEQLWVLWQRIQLSAVGRGSYLDAFVMTVIREAPLLAAEIISAAADQRPLVQKYAKLPFSVQIKALNRILALTFEDEGGNLKNLSATLVSLVKGVLTAEKRETLRSQIVELISKDSTGESEKT